MRSVTRCAGIVLQGALCVNGAKMRSVTHWLAGIVLLSALCVPVFPQDGSTAPCADVNGDEAVDVTDAVYLLDWLYSAGPKLSCEVSLLDCGDVNGDSTVDVSDAVYFLIWLFAGGPQAKCAGVPAEFVGFKLFSACSPPLNENHQQRQPDENATGQVKRLREDRSRPSPERGTKNAKTGEQLRDQPKDADLAGTTVVRIRRCDLNHHGFPFSSGLTEHPSSVLIRSRSLSRKRRLCSAGVHCSVGQTGSEEYTIRPLMPRVIPSTWNSLT